MIRSSLSEVNYNKSFKLGQLNRFLSPQIQLLTQSLVDLSQPFMTYHCDQRRKRTFIPSFFGRFPAYSIRFLNRICQNVVLKQYADLIGHKFRVIIFIIRIGAPFDQQSGERSNDDRIKFFFFIIKPKDLLP